MTAYAERFWEKTNRVDGVCWDWLGSKNPRGYGNFGIDGTTKSAHRIAWELSRGPIPAGFEIDHLCKNRGCVRPDHLRTVPPGFNVMQGSAEHARKWRAKTSCKNGHAMDVANTYWRPNGNRACRVCNALAMRRHRAKKEPMQ